MEKEKEKKFEFLMAFKKYRNLKRRVKTLNRDNNNLRKAIEEQFKENEKLKNKLKETNAKLKDIKKEVRSYEQ